MRRAASKPIALDGGDAEVWSWRRRITGTCRCAVHCATVSVSVNGADVAVDREGGRFSASATLTEGKNTVVARCRDGGGRECGSDTIALRQRLKRRPTALVSASVGRGAVLLDARGSRPSEGGGAPLVKYVWRARRDNPAPLTFRRTADDAAVATVAPPTADGEYYLSVKVVDAEGRSDTASTYFVVEGGKPRLVDLGRERPAWIERAVIYGVVPHNFGPEGFRSVTERLGHLADLGVDAIWLSPSNATPRRGHGYAVTDYFRLRRDYGTKADFRRLVKEAHARGIRVLMDFVPNHTSIEHRYMKHARKHGKASPYYDFYDRDPETGEHTHYFFWKDLPNLNYDNPEVRRWMLEAFCYWVRDFDVDGFRVDSCWGVKLRCPDFWPEWRRELKRIKPDVLLLAEASARDSYWFTHGFDAAYDWTDELGHWAMEHVFEDPGRITARLHAALTNEGRGFHEDALIFRFLNNNDTGKRFISRHGLEMEKVAAAVLLTLPGLPCIYTGQEVGAEFEPYRTSDPICWQDRHGLRDYYRRLIRLRRELPSLHSRGWRALSVEPADCVYAYTRHAGPDDSPALVAANFSAEPVRATIQLPDGLPALIWGRRLTDLLSEERVEVGETSESVLEVPMPPHCARILVAG